MLREHSVKLTRKTLQSYHGRILYISKFFVQPLTGCGTSDWKTFGGFRTDKREQIKACPII